MSRLAHNSRATVVMIAYLAVLWLLLALSVCHIVPYHGRQGYVAVSYVTTLWLMGATFIFFSAISIIVFTVYLVRREKATTTMIP